MTELEFEVLMDILKGGNCVDGFTEQPELACETQTSALTTLIGLNNQYYRFSIM